MKKFKFIILAAAALAMFLIFTGCGSKGETEVMRAEHPNPQFKRDSFINLNGQWDFKFDSTDYNMKINVPFCFESELSGIGDKTFHSECSYKRSFSLDDIEGKKVLLHIGACDYDTTVKINGTETGNHRGGYTPINLDITEAVKKTPDLPKKREENNTKETVFTIPKMKVENTKNYTFIILLR